MHNRTPSTPLQASLSFSRCEVAMWLPRPCEHWKVLWHKLHLYNDASWSTSVHVLTIIQD